MVLLCETGGKQRPEECRNINCQCLAVVCKALEERCQGPLRTCLERCEEVCSLNQARKVLRGKTVIQGLSTQAGRDLVKMKGKAGKRPVEHTLGTNIFRYENKKWLLTTEEGIPLRTP